MRRDVLLIAALAVALMGADAAGDDGTAAPAGIAPANTTLAAVMAAHRKAVGRLAPGVPRTRTEQWNVHLEGLDGTQTSAEAGKDDRNDSTLGPFHRADGTFGGRGWHQNENGEVVLEHGLHQLDDVSDRAVATQSKGVTLLGAVAAPVAAYVVKVAPPGGRIEYLYYARDTGLLVRRDRSVRGRRRITTYADFRTTAGLTEAWHVHTTDGRLENDGDYTMTALALGKPVDPSLLAIPPAKTPVSLSGPRVSVPIKMIGDRIIIPVTIAGHTVDFQMDSGASGIVIDDAIVDALKLKTYGKGTGDTAGSYSEGSTIVPSMTFGGVTMTDVQAQSLPFTFWSDAKTPVAGLMGFDFIDGAVMHIDYLDGTLEAIDPKTFVPPAGAKALPIALDDDVPLVDVGIAKAIGHLFIVDTGADRSALFSTFVAAHPGDVVDQGLGDQMVASYPFVTDFNGVGGTVKYRPLQVGPLTLAGIVFPKWLFQGTHDAPAFEADDFDGLIGQDVLRNFDVYLDYAHEKIWLVPNARYNARWG
jgi:hypothetical protein